MAKKRAMRRHGLCSFLHPFAIRRISGGNAMQHSISVLVLVTLMLGGKDDEVSAKRLALMQKKVASIEVKSSEEGFPAEFGSKPIFRYSDPARGYVAAAVWKVGETGRPRA